MLSFVVDILLIWSLIPVQCGITYYVSPSGSDSNSGRLSEVPFRTIQKAVDLSQPGDTVVLETGVYFQDVKSIRDGRPDAPIVLEGTEGAVVRGGGRARVFEINHDYITLRNFTIDGLWGDPSKASGYRDKLIFALGKQIRDGVTGLKVINMTLRNAGGECLRLRYFARWNEIAYSSIRTCGVVDFRFSGGGKNGEGVYIGTAPEQLADGKNPTADPDQSTNNWVHDNVFDTEGAECVDVKESTSGNVIENNSCTGLKDPISGGFESRGNENIFRYNQIFGNAGAGIRLGGDTPDQGIGNHIYGNNIHDNAAGGIKVMRQPQGSVCGNTMSNNTGGDVVGAFPLSISPTSPCSFYSIRVPSILG